MLESIGIVALIAVIGGSVGVAVVNENGLSQEEVTVTEQDQILDQEATIKNSTANWHDVIE